MRRKSLLKVMCCHKEPCLRVVLAHSRLLRPSFSHHAPPHPYICNGFVQILKCICPKFTMYFYLFFFSFCICPQSPPSSFFLSCNGFVQILKCICPKSKMYFFIDLYQYLYFPRVVSFSAFLSSCSSSSIYKIYLSRFPKCIF